MPQGSRRLRVTTLPDRYVVHAGGNGGMGHNAVPFAVEGGIAFEAIRMGAAPAAGAAVARGGMEGNGWEVAARPGGGSGPRSADCGSSSSASPSARPSGACVGAGPIGRPVDAARAPHSRAAGIASAAPRRGFACVAHARCPPTCVTCGLAAAGAARCTTGRSCSGSAGDAWRAPEPARAVSPLGASAARCRLACIAHIRFTLGLRRMFG